MDPTAKGIFTCMWARFIVDGSLEQVERKIRSFGNDGEVIAFIRGVMDENNLMQSIKLEGDSKCNDKAVDCRKRGNDFFSPKYKEYFKAVKQYNESVALAEDSSETLALAYANRSAVCFYLKEYDDCLENIRLARENHYPVNLLPKLVKREEDCKAAMNQVGYQEIKDIRPIEMKLSYNPKLKIPFIAECLELVQTENFGRGLITNRDLKTGDVVAFEKPFSKVLDADLFYTNCNYCLEDKFLTLRPCKGCTITMFCSDDCQQKALDSYHRVECPILKDIERLMVDSDMRVVLRITVMALSTFDHDLEELRLFMESGETNFVNAFEYDWTNITTKEKYGLVYNLETNRNKIRPAQLAQYSINAIVICDALLKKTSLRNICKTSSVLRDIIERLLVRHQLLQQVNAFSVEFRDFEDKCYTMKKIMTCVYPISSMMNHSCARNVNIIFLPEGKLAMVVHRPIGKGSQLTFNYSVDFTKKTLQDRQQHLNKLYYFICKCEACINDYPKSKPVPHGLVKEINEEVEKFDFDPGNLLHQMKMHLHLLNKFDRHYPCDFMQDLQEDVTVFYKKLYWIKSRKLKYETV